MNKIVKVDFYYSIGSRYSYLAATQIDALQQATGTQVEWQPINSVRLLAQREISPFAGKPSSGQYEWAYRELDAQRWAKLYGVPYLEPRGRVEFDSELLARSCTAAKRLGKVAPYSRLLFAAMFQESLAKIDESKCIAIAQECDIESSDFQLALNSPATADRLNATIDRAHQAGVFGVPTFIALDELFWGNDRIVLLSHYLQNKLRSDRKIIDDN
jgi:2-hydroxychromene-2-carboxylate isomerase